MDVEFSSFNVLDRMVEAVRLVQDRLLRSVDALSRAKIRYAICGGNAAMAWTESVDPSAVRYTPKVEHLIRRSELPAAIDALSSVGFVHHSTSDKSAFVDGPNGRVYSGLFLHFAAEMPSQTCLFANPDVDEIELRQDGHRLLKLESFIRMELAHHRTVNKVLVRDLIDVGLIDQSWPKKLPPPLDQRLQDLLDDPDG